MQVKHKSYQCVINCVLATQCWFLHIKVYKFQYLWLNLSFRNQWHFTTDLYSVYSFYFVQINNSSFHWFYVLKTVVVSVILKSITSCCTFTSHGCKHVFTVRKTNKQCETFLRISAIIPMRVRTCWRDSPSRGTPSANLSTLSATGSHRCRMNSET